MLCCGIIVSHIILHQIWAEESLLAEVPSTRLGVVVATCARPRSWYMLIVCLSERDSLTTLSGYGVALLSGPIAASSGMARRAVALTLRPIQLWNNHRLQVLVGTIMLAKS